MATNKLWRRQKQKARRVGALTAERLEPRLLLATVESGDFVLEVERLKDLAFASGSGLYVVPTAQEQADFGTLAATVASADIFNADAQAGPLGYEVVEFTDTVSGDLYYGLREQLSGGQQTKGWGSYFVNVNYQSDGLVEVPHPLFDTNSWDVGAKAFRDADARGFLMAGAHRNANGTGTADVAHLTDSIFQTVHETWVGATSATDAWQVHGFDIDNHPSFPVGTEAVLSNGDGTVSSEVVELDANLESNSFETYAYNTLAPTDPTNQTVNGGVDGTTFSGLAGTTNEQGIHSRSLGGIFVHVELEQSIRFNATNRDLAAADISNAILAESSFLVTGSEIRSAVPDLTVTVDFGASVDASSVQPGDLIVNGSVSATGVTVDDVDTVTFTIAGLAGGTHSLDIAAGSITADDGTAIGAWLRTFDVASNSQYTINHSPRLQLGDAPLAGFAGSSSDQVELLWQTMSAGAGTQDSFIVDYRLAGTSDPWVAAPATSQIPIPSGSRVNHYTVITGLTYDTNYEYRLRHLAADVIVDEYSSPFHTRLPAGDQTNYTFAAYGDSADINDIQPFRDVQARINTVDPAFAVLLGDNVYDSGTHNESDARFDPTINPEAAAWTAGHIDYVGFGNHDVATDGGQPGEDNFSVPVPVAGVTAPAEPPASEPMEHNYSFDYGDVHFVTFDTNSLNNASRLDGQLTWVEADLAASTAQWNIVFGHHPVTGSPDKPESAADNYYQQVVPRLRAAGVDVFLMGHSHTYHRTMPLLGESGGVETFVLDTDNDYAKGAGLIQLVAGTGGKSLRSGTFTQYPFNAAGFSTSTTPVVEYGFAQFDVTPNQLTISYIAADDGAIIDQFTITDGPDTNPPTASLSNPQDNGASDLDPAIDSVLVTATEATFDIQLSDGTDIDDGTVVSAAVSLTKDATPLVESNDYSFSYNAANDVITLTSLGGDFGDGIYTITLSGGAATIDDTLGNAMSSTELTVEIDTSIQNVSFQQGVSDYASTVDTMLQEGSPSANNSAVASLNVDTDDPSGSGQDVQALLRFDNVFGSNPGQIPSGATVVSAALELNVTNLGDSMTLHRMLTSWSDTDSWNSTSGGISANDVEAVSVADATTGSVPTGLLQIDVTSSLQVWSSNPSQNLGWAILPTGTNGVDFDSSEGTTTPRLAVQFQTAANPAGITVGTISGDTTETGGTATFDVVLDGQPTDDVTIAVTSSDPGEGTPDVSQLTFTDLDWDVPQTVTVTGVDDLFVDGDIGYTVQLSPAVSNDPGYNGLDPSDLSVTNLDNDVPVANSYFPTNGQLIAGGTNYTAGLEPTADPFNAATLQTTDGSAQSITEGEGLVGSSKKPKKTSALDYYQWSFGLVEDVTSFQLDAWRDANSEGDDFQFEYSLDSGPWTLLATVNTSGTQAYDVDLSAAPLNGDLLLRVVDTNRSPVNGNNTPTFESVHVDAISFDSVITDLREPVNITASDASAVEFPLDNGEFTISRNGTSGDLTVFYTVSGSAAPGSDYVSLASSATILDGQTSTTITVTPMEDGDPEGDETVIVTLDEDDSYPYKVGTSGSATVTITDDDVNTFTATSETTVSGTIIANDYTATIAADGTVETIEEQRSGGKPSDRTSFMDHRWTFTGVSGAQSFHLTASRPNNSEGDDFEFQYSDDGGQNWTTLTTVNTSSLTLYPVNLASPISGTVIVRVIDTDPNTAGNSTQDAVDIDEMHFSTSPLAPLALNAPLLSARFEVAPLNEQIFEQTVSNAIQYWTGREPNSVTTRLLTETQFEVVSITSPYLGLAHPGQNLIQIDADASGFGWGRVSLFDTLVHEIGHLYGHDHDELGATISLLGAVEWIDETVGDDPVGPSLIGFLPSGDAEDLDRLFESQLDSRQRLGSSARTTRRMLRCDAAAVDELCAESDDLLEALWDEFTLFE